MTETLNMTMTKTMEFGIQAVIMVFSFCITAVFIKLLFKGSFKSIRELVASLSLASKPKTTIFFDKNPGIEY